MVERLIKVRPIDDGEVVATFWKVMEIVGEGHVTSLTFEVMPGFPLSIQDIGDVERLSGRRNFALAKVSFAPEAQRHLNISYESKPDHALFKVSMQRGHDQWKADFEKVNNALEVIFDLGPALSDADASDESKALQQLMSSASSMQTRMLNRIQDRLEDLEKARRDLEAEFEAKKAALYSEIQEQRLELDSEREELKLLSHEAARRKLASELRAAKVKKNREEFLPSAAIITRWGVFLGGFLFASFTGFFAYVALGSANLIDSGGSGSVDPIGVVQLFKGTLLTALSVVSLGFSVNWLRRFYEADLEYAKKKHRLSEDIDRASWVVETILDVQKNQGGTLPEAWVHQAMAGLFTDEMKRDELSEAQQALAALMGLSASASIGPNGPQINISKSGAKKLAKAASE